VQQLGQEAGMRRFELVEGSSSKFWEIAVEGASVTVRFGRIGTNGQTQTKPFADAAAAVKEQDKLVKEKTRKGYVEVGGPPSPDEAAAAPAPAPAPAAPAPPTTAAAPPVTPPAAPRAPVAPVVVAAAPADSGEPG